MQLSTSIIPHLPDSLQDDLDRQGWSYPQQPSESNPLLISPSSMWRPKKRIEQFTGNSRKWNARHEHFSTFSPMTFKPRYRISSQWTNSNKIKLTMVRIRHTKPHSSAQRNTSNTWLREIVLACDPTPNGIQQTAGIEHSNENILQ